MLHRLIPALLVMLVCASPSLAQTGVQAHYADGQVWVRWIEDASPPETYAIYSRNAPFTRVADAVLLGRLFREEWLPLTLQSQAVSPPPGWVIPDATGGRDTLASNQGLFVGTPLQAGNRWFAVVRYGDTLATPGVNLTGPIALPPTSSADPPEPQLQYEYGQGGQWRLSWYAMWAHGQADHRGGRPDFPIMANAHKSGMPSLFLLSRPIALPSGPRPLVHWLHGGGGTASQSKPGSRSSIGIDPLDGFLCAHNDDLIRYMQGAGVVAEPTNSWHFGWTVNHNPFDPSFVTPALTDTVIDYTQRRYKWIHQWLLAKFPIDPTRVAIQGHSLGSAGTTALAKSSPELFSTATIFNNGFLVPEDSAVDEIPSGATVAAGVNLFGMRADALPTNLIGPGGQAVKAYDLFDLTTPVSARRDRPLMRSFHGKHDVNGTMEWDADVVAQYRAADSIGLGAHLYWDERAHGTGALPAYFTHGDLPADQSGRDDVVYQGRYRNDRSYPAFYAHARYPDSRDPGDGTRGTTADSIYSGDDWGTWGGFHDWAPDTLLDTTTDWGCEYWLVTGSASLPDNCPFDSLAIDVAIRRPQSFLPPPGVPYEWSVTNLVGDTLQRGSGLVAADGLVTATGVVARRSPDRRRMRFRLAPPVSVEDRSPNEPLLALSIAPVPARSTARVSLRLARSAAADVSVFDLQGRRVATLARGRLAAGLHSFVWDSASLAPGVFVLRAEADGSIESRRVITLR